MKIGDKIIYTPTILVEDRPTTGVIKQFEPAGAIFRMDMVGIDEVIHWIPACDCEVVRS